MNRFLSKKKTGEAPLTSPPQASKKWRKASKSRAVEEKPQLDLSSALPSSDDFRTSLIMPTLSTRFSMLREQDDPNSKLGKASDDSVLQPQRSSRLLDFGFSNNTLNDIAEVASIKSSIRPPFARERHDSYGSEEGYGTDNDSTANGSVMSRARPGEGNVLFGGRQKVYKIPTGSARSVSAASERNTGRVLYEDDINMSAFQKYRAYQQREAARAAEQEQELLDQEVEDRDSLEDGENHIPTRTSEDPGQGIGLGLTRSESNIQSFKRSSDSTTTSGPSQGNMSTAATSVASQSIGTAVTSPTAQPATTAPAVPSLERSLTKRRLYEQGLEKNMYEQQASTMTRLNSIQRHRSPTVGSAMSPPTLSHSRSIGQMQERGFQPYAVQHSSQSAANAFPPLTIRKPSSDNSSPMASYPQSPLSPTMSDSEEYKTLHSALEPGDRGKATALGAFNRPKQQYDEEQYTQRQVQLQQSNQSSKSRQNSVDLTKRSESRLARFDSARHTDEADARNRSASVSTSVSPKTEQSPSNAFSVFQNAAVQNRVVHGENPHLPPAAPLPPPPSMADTHRTFFGDISPSDDEEDDFSSDHERAGPLFANNYMSPSSNNGRFTPTSLTSVSEHPALRHDTSNLPAFDEEEEDDDEPMLPIQSPTSKPFVQQQQIISTETEVRPRAGSVEQDVDSPTIGGNKDSLGGLIHHLRNTSDQSSIYPPASRGYDSADHSFNPDYSAPTAWDLDELESYYGDATADRPSSRRESTPSRGQPLAPAPSKGNISSRPSTRDSGVIDGFSWQSDFKKHTRDTSTATQAERQAFDNELAARQKAIQEKMKSIVESESRGPSPAPSAGGALKAFGMLKSKPSQEAMSRDGSSKAMKMLGLGAQPDKYSIYEDPQANNSAISHANTWAPVNNPQWPLGAPKEQRSFSNFSVRSPPQDPASRERSRSRSGSIASRARSGSRTNGYRDDFGSPPSVMPPLPVARPSIDTTKSMTPPSGSEGGAGRLRSNSKPNTYFDYKSLYPAQNGTPTGRMTPGGISPQSGVSPGPFSSASTTPRPSYSTASSSQGSKNASPAMGAPHVPAMRAAGSLLRKKTINKADIGEPTLISSTSNVDTVDLPTARTIVQPPLIPPLNPRRRVFTHGEAGPSAPGDVSSAAELRMKAFSPPPPQHAATYSGHPGLRSMKSQESVAEASPARFDAIGSPVMNEAGMF